VIVEALIHLQQRRTKDSDLEALIEQLQDMLSEVRKGPPKIDHSSKLSPSFLAGINNQQKLGLKYDNLTAAYRWFNGRSRGYLFHHLMIRPRGRFATK
jgi:hypothetical protein